MSEHGQQRVVQVEDAQGLIHGGQRFSHPPGQVALCQVELVHQSFERTRFFHEVQILAVQVLDELQGQTGLLRDGAENDALKGTLKNSELPACCREFVLTYGNSRTPSDDQCETR